jgi:hypothetical protein
LSLLSTSLASRWTTPLRIGFSYQTDFTAFFRLQNRTYSFMLLL